MITIPLKGQGISVRQGDSARLGRCFIIIIIIPIVIIVIIIIVIIIIINTCERSRDFNETRGLSQVGTIVDKEFLPRFRYIKLLRLILMI